MSNTFSLDDLDAAIEQQFAPFRFVAGEEEFVLRNVVRLNEKERETVMSELSEMEKYQDEEAAKNVDVKEIVASMQTILKTVTADGKGPKLLKAVGNDLMRNRVLLERWMEATQTGEAQDSPA